MSALLVPLTDDGVDLSVAGRPADGARQVEVDLGDVSAADSCRPRSYRPRPGRSRSISLDVVEVHDDVAEVAGEPHPSAVGRGLEVLVAVASR